MFPGKGRGTGECAGSRQGSWRLGCGAVAAGAVQAAQADAGVLERTRETGVFRIGYRTDAAPLSYQNDIGEADGYSLALCRVVASAVRRNIGVGRISVQYVPVGTNDRFDALRDGRIDILCGSTSVTLERRKQVDFSLVTFVDGASVLFREDGPHTFEELEHHKVGVRARTTTERTLRRTLNELSVGAEVVPLRDHADGLRQLEQGRTGGILRRPGHPFQPAVAQ